ncbi:MAG: class I SAM-dependent methyltransferase, partial [Siphonobacter sp.]
VPLAILFPECQFHLVDSIGKKIKVVQEVSKALGLTNVRAEQKRAELVPAQAYDFVVSRAVTRITPFYDWVKNKVHKNQFNDLRNGILYLKGGDLEEELQELKRKTVVYTLSDYFSEEFFETKKVVHVPF